MFLMIIVNGIRTTRDRLWLSETPFFAPIIERAITV